jgi:copper(I)-binding protein
MKIGIRLLVLCIICVMAAAVLAQDGTSTPVPLPSVIDRPADRPARSVTGPQVSAGALQVVDAWVRPVRAGATTALYATLANTTSKDYTLTAVRVDFAAIIELHQSMMQGDMMRMREIEGGIPVPQGQRTALRPGGLHVMLMNATRALEPGEAVAVVFVFIADDGETLNIQTAARVSDEPLPEVIYFDAVSLYAHPVIDADGVITALEVYGEINNWGAPSVNLIGISASFAGVGEVRETYLTDSGARTRAVGWLPAPFGARLIMRPNGYFALLTEFAADFQPEVGAAYSAALLFEEGMVYPIAFIVREADTP